MQFLVAGKFIKIEPIETWIDLSNSNYNKRAQSLNATHIVLTTRIEVIVLNHSGLIVPFQ